MAETTTGGTHIVPEITRARVARVIGKSLDILPVAILSGIGIALVIGETEGVWASVLMFLGPALVSMIVAVLVLRHRAE